MSTEGTELQSLYPVSAAALEHTPCDNEKYLAMYQHSIEDPEGFWNEHKDRIDWFTAPTKIKNTSFEGDVSIKWFEDGVLNACYNCVDRHAATIGDQVALIF